MNHNELVQEAENKISNKEYELAAQMFHDIAAQTGDIYCTKKALDLYMLLAEADLGLMDSGLGMSMIEYAVKDINTAYRFITGCMLNHNIMNEIGEHVKARHADCLFMIGKIKFLQEDPECLDYFKEASSYGKNMANMLAGVWYDKQVSRMLKEEDPDTDLLIEMSKSAIQSFETFIEKYNPSEAESDEFETANLLVSFYYEVGLGTEVDKQHAAEHKQKAGHLNK